MPPGVEICAELRRGEANATIALVKPASTRRLEWDRESVFVHRSNRTVSIVSPPRFAAQPRRASHPVNAGDDTSVPGHVVLLALGGTSGAIFIPLVSVYVRLEGPVILPSLSAAASARADIVDARWLDRGEGRRDDSTRLAHLASSRDACQTVGWTFPVRHDPDGIGDRNGSGLLLPLRPIPGTSEWPVASDNAAVSAAGAPLCHRPQPRHRIDGLRVVSVQPGTHPAGAGAQQGRQESGANRCRASLRTEPARSQRRRHRWWNWSRDPAAGFEAPRRLDHCYRHSGRRWRQHGQDPFRLRHP